MMTSAGAGSAWLQWLVALRHPADIWRDQPSLLAAELVYYLLAALTLRHALLSGVRHVHLWLCIVAFGVCVECLTYFTPGVDNFWHAQAVVMLFGRRLPLWMALLYPVFFYTSAVAVDRLKLGLMAASCATGLGVVLIDLPFDIIGVKLLWWSFHDTDPNLYDRFYHVPWNTLFFLSASSMSLHLVFFGSRQLLCGFGRDHYEAGGAGQEFTCSLITSLLTIPLATLQLALVYHGLHDLLGVHTGVCVLLLLTTYTLLTVSASTTNSRHTPVHPPSYDILGVIIIHFLLYFTLAAVETPELIRSTGIHQTVGACDVTVPLYTPVPGLVHHKKEFLCLSKFNVPYYDFHCVPTPPQNSSWYTVCGTAWSNRPEYIVLVGTLCIAGTIVYSNIICRCNAAVRSGSSWKKKQ